MEMLQTMLAAEELHAKQVLEFLTVTGPPGRGNRGVDDDESRRIVRSHAIRDANRRKKYSLETNAKTLPTRVSSKPLPQSNFTAKFRVQSKPKRKINEKGAAGTEETLDVDKSLMALSKHIKTQARLEKSLLISPGASKFDPFDALPVTIGSGDVALIEYQRAALNQNVFAFYSRERLFSFASADPAWLNATLSLISLHHDIKFSRSVSQECLYRRGEALRIINKRLTKSPQEVSDHTIGAIATLSSWDITNGLFLSAAMHMKGLVHILSNRGTISRGLFALEGNDLLQKVVAWADLSYATSWDTAPRFPILQTDYCSGTLDEFLYVFAPQFDSPDLTSAYDLFGEMAEIFQAMRLLSICMTQSKVTADVQAMFTRGLYIVEYKLLIVLDQTDPRDDDIVLSRNSHMFGSCRLAAYLYIYIMLRELPRIAEINQTLARRLMVVLGGNKADLMVVWKNDLYLLLWIVTMGGMVTLGPVGDNYFLGILKRLKSTLGLESQAMYETALSDVLWIDNKCWNGATKALWNIL